MGFEAKKQCRYKYAREHAWVNQDGKTQSMNCKSWRCEIHAAAWSHKWKIILARECAAHPIDRLVTLTLTEDCLPSELVLMRKYLFRDLRNKYGDIQYFYSLEFTTKTTLPHFHCLFRGQYIPQQELSAAWEKATKGFLARPASIVWIEKPRNDDVAAWYLLDYDLSTQKNQDIPDSFLGRKIGYSKGFFKSGTTKDIWEAYIAEKYPPDHNIWVLHLVNPEDILNSDFYLT